MNAVTRLDDAELDELLQRYDLGQISACSLAANGIENSNYFITLDSLDPVPVSRDFVLTIIEQPSNSGGRAYVELLDACERAGLPTPGVVRNAAGQSYESLNNKPVLLCRRLRGQHVLNPTLAQTAAIGRFLGRFHLRTSHLASYLPAYPRSEQWLADSLEAIKAWASFQHYAQAADAVTSVRSMLARDDVQALPRSVIHGDLFRDNALFNSAGLTGVLDFHHAATGYSLYDLAVVANDWCSDTEGRLDPDRMLMLLRGYHQIRPLQAQELWFLSLFTLYAGLSFYLSRAKTAATLARNQTGRSARSKNPDEFARIVRQRLAHAFYLDPRLL